jgi:lipoprotein-anchoring transpeptidase ErfK/SrfK
MLCSRGAPPGGRRLFSIGIVGVVAATMLGLAHDASSSTSRTAAKTKPESVSVVAQAKGRLVRVYRSGAKRPYMTLHNPTADGAPLVFLVQKRVRYWDKVYLPVRPNGSTGWIHSSSVRLALDPYRVVVALRSHRVNVYKRNRLVHSERAGVGRSVLPTPSGTYFIVSLLKQPNPHGAYGPYAFGLSAYSNVLQSFGGGPGQIGLHGTDNPGGLGTNVSHGCIRIGNAGITRLARMLPLGTRVVIKR